MKKIALCLTLLSCSLAVASRAATVTGFVLCDANQNGAIDSGDAGIANVLVVVTNQTGSFSNSAVTAADGSFSAQIPNFDSLEEVRDPLSQVYVETVATATLPAGSTILLPLAITNLSVTPAYYIDFAADLTNVVYTSASGTGPTGDWLINNPECQSAGNCELIGRGQITTGKKPNQTFSGMIRSGNPPSGRWLDVARALKLRFESTAIQTASCGAGTIDFTGTGTLRGLAGNKTRINGVLFTAHAEDHGKPGKNGNHADSYYLRVYTSDGTTLLLVSGDLGNPEDIAPVPVTHGNLTIRGE